MRGFRQDEEGRTPPPLEGHKGQEGRQGKGRKHPTATHSCRLSSPKSISLLQIVSCKNKRDDDTNLVKQRRTSTAKLTTRLISRTSTLSSPKTGNGRSPGEEEGRVRKRGQNEPERLQWWAKHHQKEKKKNNPCPGIQSREIESGIIFLSKPQNLVIISSSLSLAGVLAASRRRSEEAESRESDMSIVTTTDNTQGISRRERKPEVASVEAWADEHGCVMN